MIRLPKYGFVHDSMTVYTVTMETRGLEACYSSDQ